MSEILESFCVAENDGWLQKCNFYTREDGGTSEIDCPVCQRTMVAAAVLEGYGRTPKM
jgi:hypothetical protein